MFGNFSNVKVQTFGERTSVPDDDVAKLMYYLSCVDTVINYNEIDRLTDYENYDLLSVDSMAELFKLVLLFNPKIFIETGIFILDEYLLPYGFDNQFYQITDERIGIHVNNEIMIGGRTVQVLKVMACNQRWLDRNYFRPWNNLLDLTEKYQRYKTSFYIPPPPPKPIYTPRPRTFYTPPKPSYNSYSSNYVPSLSSYQKRKDDECHCSCIIF